MIYLDNAATSAVKPQVVLNAVNQALNNYNANPGRSGHSMSVETSEMIYSVRVKAASLFNANGAESIVFTPSCTIAVNTVMQGILKPGDHMIMSSLEHNCVTRTARRLEEKGVEVDIADFDFDSTVTRNNFENLIKSNTKLIICTHASNVFGVVLPIEKIGRLCKEREILFAVDAAQTAGVIGIDMKKMNINYLCAAPHKGLFAPMGTGILVTDAEPEPLIYGGTGSASHLQNQPDFTPDKYESGTLNVSGIAGIGAGIDYVSKRMKDIFSHETMFVKRIYDKLHQDERFEFYHDFKSCPFVPVLSMNAKEYTSEEVAKYLNDNRIAVRAGLHCAPLAHRHFNTVKRGTVRISPSIFNRISQADTLINSLYKLYK